MRSQESCDYLLSMTDTAGALGTHGTLGNSIWAASEDVLI